MITHAEQYEQVKEYYLRGRSDVLKMIIEQLKKRKDISIEDLLKVLQSQLKTEQ